VLIYLRPSAILVRRGNPEKVTGVTDLFQPSYKKLSISKRGFIALLPGYPALASLSTA
jgi:accessory colonization factor AcfC